MDKLVIQGGKTLSGDVSIGGSKNTALPLMAGAILAGGKTTISNVPNLKDVRTFSRVMDVTGANVNHDRAAGQLTVDATVIDLPEAPYELVKRMRASFYMLGALMGRCGQAKVSLPGGCAWGPRPVDLHIKGLEALGAEVHLDQGYVIARAPAGRLTGGAFALQPSSVGATVNFLLGAVTATGSSRLENAACEPDVVVFGHALQQMGARIEGLGTTVLEIEGVDSLDPIAFTNCPDRIELGTYMIAAAIACRPGEALRLLGGNSDHLGDTFIEKFRETGAGLEIGRDAIVVTAPERLHPVSIETAVYPGFPTDLQAQWTVLLSQAHGEAQVVDSVYRDRFKHIPELQRMGLKAEVADNVARVHGATRLQGAQVMSTDLRASVSLVLAGLVAQGETHVLRVYHLDRGYDDIEGKLRRAGAVIDRVAYDEFADPAATLEHEQH